MSRMFFERLYLGAVALSFVGLVVAIQFLTAS